VINAFAYVGSGLQSLCIGVLIPDQSAGTKEVPIFGFSRNWEWLPVFVIPFAIIGLIIAIRIWHDLPEATRRFNAQQAARSPVIAGVPDASQ
jgi:OPA family glycerol-3-phosphate transporter-like MFS transporter